MPESSADLQREIAETRRRMSETVDDIDARVSGQVEAVKEKLDVTKLVSEHPWPALAIALSAGILLSATGADARAVGATTAAAKKASKATVGTARKVGRTLRGQSDDEASVNNVDAREEYEGDWRPVAAASRTPRLGERLFAIVAAPLTTSLDRVLDEMRAASRDFGASLAAGRRPTTASAADGQNAEVPFSR